MTTLPRRPDAALRRTWFVTGAALLLGAAVLALSLLGQASRPVHAQAAPVSQCNNDAASNVGGQGIACTVTVVNYVSGDGTLAATPASTVTTTVCTGAAGPIAAGAGTCATTTTTSAAPVTLVQQCNGSGNGGGGVVICTVTVTNNFTGSPTAPLTDATIYQCIGSEITGTGAPGSCTPVNTPGITSVTAATVGQCNGSGNGGTSVEFVCTVTGGSTTTATLAVNVDQCNGSANGGGALTRCTATVTNNVTAQVTPTPTAVPTVAPTAAPTVAPTAAPTVAPTVAPTAATPPAGATPVAPTPAETGNAGAVERGETLPLVAWLLTASTLGLVLLGRRLVVRRSSR